MSQRSDRAIAFALIMSAGYIDGYGLFAYGAFLSFMSGNTTLAAYNLAQGKAMAALPTLIAVIGFVSGATIGTALARAAGNLSRRVVLVIVAVLQSAVLAMTYSRALPNLAAIGTLSAAMGMLNRAVTTIGGHPVSLTFVTGTLSRLASHLSNAMAGSELENAGHSRDTHARRAAALGGVWLSFLLGAVLAGILAPRLDEWALAPPIVVLIMLAIVIAPSPMEQ